MEGTLAEPWKCHKQILSQEYCSMNMTKTLILAVVNHFYSPSAPICVTSLYLQSIWNFSSVWIAQTGVHQALDLHL